MLHLKFLTQELLVAHLSSCTSQSQKVTLSLTRPPPGKSSCSSKEDRGTKSQDRVPVTLAYRYQFYLDHCKLVLRLRSCCSLQSKCVSVQTAVWHAHYTIQVNLVTAWIDGSSIYGPSTSWSDSRRSFSGGLLTSGSEWNMPKKGGRQMWSAADPSTREAVAQGLYGEKTKFW